jgi:hypothetical protein
MGEGAGVQVLGMLDVDVVDRVNGGLKTASQLLKDIAASNRFMSMDSMQQLDMIQRLGISPDMLLLMQKGKANMVALTDEARRMGLITAETAKRSEQWQDALARAKFMVRTVATNIAGELVPILIKLTDQFTAWFVENKKIIKQNLEKLIKDLASVVEFLSKHVKPLLALLTAIVTLKFGMFIRDAAIAIGFLRTGLKFVNKELLITNTMLVAIPALILGIILMLQDMYVWLKGGDSLMGRWGKTLEGFEGFTNFIVGAIKWVDKWKERFSDAAKFIKETLVDLGKEIWEYLLGPAYKVIAKYLELRKLLDEQKEIIKENLQNMNRGKLPLPGQPSKDYVPPGYQRSGEPWSKSIMLNPTFNIQSTDPMGVGVEVSRQIKDLITQASGNVAFG